MKEVAAQLMALELLVSAMVLSHPDQSALKMSIFQLSSDFFKTHTGFDRETKNLFIKACWRRIEGNVAARLQLDVDLSPADS